MYHNTHLCLHFYKPILSSKKNLPPQKNLAVSSTNLGTPNSAVDAEADVATAAAAGVVTAVLASRQMRHEKNPVPYFPLPIGSMGRLYIYRSMDD